MSVVFRCLMRDFSPSDAFAGCLFIILTVTLKPRTFSMFVVFASCRCAICLYPQYFVFINGSAFVLEEWNISQQWHPREELVCLRSLWKQMKRNNWIGKSLTGTFDYSQVTWCSALWTGVQMSKNKSPIVKQYIPLNRQMSTRPHMGQKSFSLSPS